MVDWINYTISLTILKMKKTRDISLTTKTWICEKVRIKKRMNTKKTRVNTIRMRTKMKIWFNWRKWKHRCSNNKWQTQSSMTSTLSSLKQPKSLDLTMKESGLFNNRCMSNKHKRKWRRSKKKSKKTPRDKSWPKCWMLSNKIMASNKTEVNSKSEGKKISRYSEEDRIFQMMSKKI